MKRTLPFVVLMFAAACAKTDSEFARMMAKGDVLFQSGDFTGAATAFENAVERYPAQATARLARGHSLFASGDFPGAAESIQQGVSMRPGWARQPLNLEAFFSRHPRVFAKRRKELARLASLDAENEGTLFLHGYVLHFSGEHKAARKTFTHLLHVAPDHLLAAAFMDAAPKGEPKLASAIDANWFEN